MQDPIWLGTVFITSERENAGHPEKIVINEYGNDYAKEARMLAQVIPIVRSNTAFEAEADWKEPFLHYMGERMADMDSKGPIESLSDISALLWAGRAEILGQLALTFISRRFGELLTQEFCSCPLCGKTLKYRGVHKREVITLSARFDLRRPYFYCVTCSHGFYPLDEALGLSGSAKQHDVQELATWLATELPFEAAEDAMKRSTGIEMSSPAIHGTVKAVSAKLDVLDDCPSKQEILVKITELSEGKRIRPVLMLTLDGAMAPVRPEPSPYKGERGSGDWEEVKGFRLYLIDKDRIIHLMSWHQIGTADDLASALLAIKQAELIPEDRVRLCVVADGAAWIWNRIEQLFPTAKQVLDYYHCSEHLHELAAAQYGKGTLKAQEWVDASLLRLFLKQKSHVIAGIKRMKPASAEAANLIKQTAAYLKKHSKRLDYGTLRRGGYHIGSGAIESANKLICHVRLKRPGAWWYPSNANNMLKLRCAKYNGTYGKVMQLHRLKDQRRTIHPPTHQESGAPSDPV